MLLTLALALVACGAEGDKRGQPVPPQAVAPSPVPPSPGAAQAPGQSLPPIRIASPPPVQTMRQTFDDGGNAPSGWAKRAEPGAPSGPNALCQSGGETSLYVLRSEPGGTEAKFVNGRIAAQVKLPASGAAGLVLHAQDPQTYYRVRADASSGAVGIDLVSGGADTRIAETRAALAAGSWTELRATITDNTVFVWLNGRQILNGADETIPGAGGAGVWAAGNSGACFDDVQAEWR